MQHRDGPAATRVIDELKAGIARGMLADQPRLHRRLRALVRAADGRGAGKPAWDRLAEEIARSAARRDARIARRPRPRFSDRLPVSARRADVIAALAAHQVVVVCGETGSGKTTQLPKICLEMGRGAGGLIGHTQPRRIAARSVARRIAQDLGGAVGEAVGFKVRFTDEVGAGTYVKVMTDGILLNEIRRDRSLDAYDTIIVDEAHERSLNVDFLLGYLARLLPRRPDLKVIVTSATIDPQRFAAHFGGAPVVEISGRGYPVEVLYRPPPAPGGLTGEGDLPAAVVAAVREAMGSVPGDLLVFLPGEREIRETAAALRRSRPGEAEVLPLYARLNAAQQDRVFRPGPIRRVVLATNVAETSLTVPNIRAVVDTGLARISRYSHRRKVERLPVEPISRASAEQRKGRCGRTGPGICVRLFAADDLAARDEFTEPEIRRTNLAAVILQMTSLGLGRIDEFPFIDPPDRRFIADGYRLLRDLDALDGENRLTPNGARLARLPVDPRIGRMLLAAGDHECVAEVLVIASALSAGDPRDRPFDRRAAAAQAHAEFRDRQSDFMTYVRIWGYFHDEMRRLSGRALRRRCRERYLSYPRLREWCDVHRSLTLAAREVGLRPRREPASYARIHRALLAGLRSQVGVRRERREYQGVRDTRFLVAPSSAARGSAAQWIVAAELVETSRLYAHTVARIRPEWIEGAAADQVSRSYFDAYWDAERAEVMAFERVAYLGLTLAPRRRIRFGPVMPVEARRIFIQEGLVEGKYRTDAPFAVHNRALIAEVKEIEHKIRRLGVLVDDDTIRRFYDERIPPEVNRGAAFEKWYRRARQRDPELLFFERERLRRDGAGTADEAEFPSVLEVDGTHLRLTYRFEPGHVEDGVTAHVPLAVLPRLRPERFEWLVPGRRREKVIELMRGLPKPLRRQLVPVPARAAACLGAIDGEDGSLLTALGHALARQGIRVPRAAWRPEALSDHLRMNFVLYDEAGEVLAAGRDLAALERRFGARAAAHFSALAAAGDERFDLTQWDFPPLPARVEIGPAGAGVIGHPGLEDRGTSVALRIWRSAARARWEHRAGIRRLFMLRLGRELKPLRRKLPGIETLRLLHLLVPPDPREITGAGAGRDAGGEDLERDLLLHTVDRCFLTEEPEAWTRAEFERRLDRGRAELAPAAGALCALVRQLLETYRDVARERDALRSPARSAALADVDAQLDRLIYRGFVADTRWDHLEQVPRYLAAIRLRLEKLGFGLAGDLRKLAELRPLLDAYRSRELEAGAGGRGDPELEAFRWMLEELRISLFAQEVGTRYPVSVKRLRERFLV